MLYSLTYFLQVLSVLQLGHLSQDFPSSVSSIELRYLMTVLLIKDSKQFNGAKSLVAPYTIKTMTWTGTLSASLPKLPHNACHNAFTKTYSTILSKPCLTQVLHF